MSPAHCELAQREQRLVPVIDILFYPNYIFIGHLLPDTFNYVTLRLRLSVSMRRNLMSLAVIIRRFFARTSLRMTFSDADGPNIKDVR